MALSQHLEMKDNLTTFSTSEKKVITLLLQLKCSVRLLLRMLFYYPLDSTHGYLFKMYIINR